MTHHNFKNAKGDSVYYLKWEIASPKAILVISHGMIEHPKRYDHLAAYLT